MVVGLSVYWVIESAKAEADLNNDLKVIDAEINSLNADIAQLDEQYNTKLIPLRAELARIREQIKGYETDRDQALEGCRSKKSLRISEREDFIRIADTEIVDKLVQDMYERLVFIAIKHDLPLDGIVSSSDTSKVMKRFTHDK
jgi:phage host-nuclease inhibitor protein Gam